MPAKNLGTSDRLLNLQNQSRKLAEASKAKADEFKAQKDADKQSEEKQKEKDNKHKNIQVREKFLGVVENKGRVVKTVDVLPNNVRNIVRHRGKQLICNETKQIFNSPVQAAAELGLSSDAIYHVLRERIRKTGLNRIMGGYTFSWLPRTPENTDKLTASQSSMFAPVSKDTLTHASTDCLTPSDVSKPTIELLVQGLTSLEETVLNLEESAINARTSISKTHLSADELTAAVTKSVVSAVFAAQRAQRNQDMIIFASVFCLMALAWGVLWMIG